MVSGKGVQRPCRLPQEEKAEKGAGLGRGEAGSPDTMDGWGPGWDSQARASRELT